MLAPCELMPRIIALSTLHHQAKCSIDPARKQ